MLRLIIIIIILTLYLYTILDCLRYPKYLVQILPKTIWLILVLLMPLLGSLLWFIFGKRKGSADPQNRKFVAPDEDPNFLKQLNVERKNREKEKYLREWEQKLLDTEKKLDNEKDSNI